MRAGNDFFLYRVQCKVTCVGVKMRGAKIKKMGLKTIGDPIIGTSLLMVLLREILANSGPKYLHASMQRWKMSVYDTIWYFFYLFIMHFSVGLPSEVSRKNKDILSNAFKGSTSNISAWIILGVYVYSYINKTRTTQRIIIKCRYICACYVADQEMQGPKHVSTYRYSIYILTRRFLFIFDWEITKRSVII